LRAGRDRPEVHEVLGEIYSSKGEIKKAIAEFNQAAALGPEWPEPHLMLGYLYRDIDDLDRALEEFRIAQALNSENRDTYHGAGGTLRRMNRFSEAATEYKSAVGLDGGDAYAHMALAACYEATAQAELSEEHRKIALELGDGKIEGKYNRACFWALAGDRKLALHLLSEAISSGDTAQAMAARDIDLASLHGDPEFEAIIGAINKSKGEQIAVVGGKTA
jgi:tetratricopeptide (TPR) repeat protein